MTPYDPPATAVVVNDDINQLNLLTALLHREGIEALIFLHAEAALKHMVQNGPPNLIITDLYMPGLDGWEILTTLRRLAPDIPVILASGYDKAHVMVGDHSELPQVFLGKPYKLQELRDAIGQALVS